MLKNKNNKQKIITLKPSAFTLIETLISITLLVFIFTITSLMYFNFVKEYKYSFERNNVFSETNFLFENISKQIKNSDIDYQSYWRENTRIKNEDGTKKIADIWLTEGPNPNGVNSDLTANGTVGYNSVLNCSGTTISNDHISDYNTDSTSTGRFILENYKYQFIFPGNPENDLGDGDNKTWQYNSETKINNIATPTVHLNCKTDFVKNSLTLSGNQQNIYDDDPVYGRGPKAFSGSFSQDILWSWDYNDNSTKSKKTPLILANSQGNKRAVFRFGDGNDTECKNGSGCILFLEMNAKTFDSNGVANSWKCAEDFICPENLTGIISDEIEWLDITPENIIVTQFDFYMGPEKKSSLSFNELIYNKPSFITLKLGIKSATFQPGNEGGRKNGIELNLQSTIVPRNNSETINILN